MKPIAKLFTAALAGIGLIASPARAQPGPAEPLATVTVQVETGTLIGVRHEHALVFRDIPYAAPPIGDLRWAPPKPAIPWTGQRAALLPGPSCPQPMNADGSPNGGAASGPTSEDCLQLNVFAPPAARGAPVMVWIHGGGHRTGAGWIYDGQTFARDGVVMVAINYRLGALGYFAHPALTKAAKPGEPLGDYGMMDQMAALRWIQRNIAAFGGDPANVTVFGESAGGQSIIALLATPTAKGLFKRAIVESGGGWPEPSSLTEHEQRGAAALARVGVPADATAAELRALPLEKLVGLDGDYGPFVDGRLMTETEAQAFARGHAADVPLIIGSNSGEDSLLGFGKLGPEAVRRFSGAANTAYADEAAHGDDTLARALFTDRVMGAPARWIAARASGGQPAWLYYFSYVGSRFRPGVTRAFHAAEIQYVLDYWGRRTPMSTVSGEDHAMAALMHGCWVAFARTGAPACGAQAWPAYDPRTDQLMEFGRESGVRAHFRQAKLDAQDAVALPKLKLGKSNPN